MTKLNQIIAVEKGVKTQSTRTLTDLYRSLTKAPLFSGISRTYQPRDDEGDRLPAESTKVQLTVDRVLDGVRESLSRLFDVTATKDWGNFSVSADVIVDDQVLLPSVPIPYLLFLEKQLTDLHTVVRDIPVLDQSEDWDWNDRVEAYASKPVQTVRTKKVPRNHVRAAATDKHPAQVDVFNEDVLVGYWTTVKFSGNWSRKQVNDLLSRLEKLQTAVKFAREEANSKEVADVKVSDNIFDYLFDA